MSDRGARSLEPSGLAGGNQTLVQLFNPLGKLVDLLLSFLTQPVVLVLSLLLLLPEILELRLGRADLLIALDQPSLEVVDSLVFPGQLQLLLLLLLFVELAELLQLQDL